ncbi:MAG: starch-binding protein [Bacteroidales bacterium]|nr:starch-binding protein [Bacteroidales bacterium]
MKKIFTSLTCALALTSLAASAQHTIFINNQTGWQATALYAWGDGLTDPLGGWPGMTASGSETVNGVVFEKYAIPADLNDKALNLIYNNNNGGSQLKDMPVTLDKDYYFAAFGTGMVSVDPNEPITPPVIEYNTLFVNNGTSWTDVCVYAWADGQPELFGGWPGATAKGSENIEGVNYLTYDMQAGSTAYNLIFNSGAEQFDGPVITPDADVFVKLNPDNTATVINDPRVKYYTIYIEDKTGWDDLYVYAWGDGVPELFGGWPGVAATATETINGVAYKTFPYKSAGETVYNLIFNNNAGSQYDALAITADRDWYIVANPDNAAAGIEDMNVDNNAEAVYYNLHGIRVANPDNGLYIEVRGGVARKVQL